MSYRGQIRPIDQDDPEALMNKVELRLRRRVALSVLVVTVACGWLLRMWLW